MNKHCAAGVPKNILNNKGLDGLTPNYEPGGRGFKSCRARQYSRTYDTQSGSFFLLPDPCRTFCPQRRLSRVRDTQHGACFLTIQDQVRLLEQATDIGARVMAGHRMIGMAKQGFSILG